MKKVIPLIFLSICSTSFGQGTEKQIGFSTGWTYLALKNQAVSTFTQSGSTLPLIFFFKSNGVRDRHHVQLFYSTPNLSSSSGGLSTNVVTAYFQYAYHRKFASLKNKFFFYGGVTFNAGGAHRENTGAGSIEANVITGEGVFSWSPSILVEMPLGKDLLSVQLWSAVVAYVYQHGYARNEPFEWNWLGPSQFSSFDSRIAYQKALSPRWDTRLEYQLQYYRLSNYETLASLNHQVVASLVYKIH